MCIRDRIEAGSSLKGWEVKSLRDNRGNIKESYAILKNNEVFLIGAHFSPLRNANITDESEATRSRKLLLNKKEIAGWQRSFIGDGIFYTANTQSGKSVP